MGLGGSAVAESRSLAVESYRETAMRYRRFFLATGNVAAVGDASAGA